MSRRRISWLPPSAFAKAPAFAEAPAGRRSLGGGWPADRRSFSGGWSGGSRRPATAFRLKAEATLSVLVTLSALILNVTIAAAQMPDPRQMSGIPRPDPQLQSGVVTVRVIRGSFDNPVVSLTVELVGPSPVMRATTDDAGRAEFKGVPAGTRVKAVAVVAGERIESQEFAMPGSGGIRLALVAAAASGSPSASGPPAAAPDTSPAQPGDVVLGEDSRFIFEMGEDGLSVFYVLQISNSSSTRVQPPTPVVFELPAMARGAALLEGSSPQAQVADRRLEIKGPFAPGNTLVQVAYTAPFGGADMVIEQPLPIPLKHVAVVAQKVGNMQLSSPQMPEQQTMPANGHLYVAGRGGALAAGSVLRFAFSGMPYHSVWPRNVALGLALLILAGGAWSAFRGAGTVTARDGQRRELEARRDRLFDELTALEASHRDAKSDPEHYATRRRELVTALERIYAALDDEVAVSRAS
jgi:hypothetical protein